MRSYSLLYIQYWDGLSFVPREHYIFPGLTSAPYLCGFNCTFGCLRYWRFLRIHNIFLFSVIYKITSLFQAVLDVRKFSPHHYKH